MNNLAEIIILIVLFFFRVCCFLMHKPKNYTGGEITVPQTTIDALDYIDKHVKSTQPCLLYGDISYNYKYDGYQIYKQNCHYGQRKLLLNEIQFLTHSLNKNSIIIYVGAAPCEHLTIIQSMFPNNKYLLIDPNYCIIDAKSVYIYQNTDVISDNALRIIDTYKSGKQHQRKGVKNLEVMMVLDENKYNMIKVQKDEMQRIKTSFEKNDKNIFSRIAASDENIFIIQDYMSIELSKILMRNFDDAQESNILFISDLRTNLWNEYGPVDMDILFNDCLQIAILDIIRPKYSMLKFHPPYFAAEWTKYLKSHEDSPMKMVDDVIKYVSKLFGIDILEAHKNHKHYNYQEEYILLQPWAPTSSSEARLIISDAAIIGKKTKNYDSDDWENKYFILNMCRMYSYIDVYSTLFSADKNSQFYNYDGCIDCYIELSILSQYIYRKKIKQPELRTFVPSVDQQKTIKGELEKMSKIVNSHLRYDLKNNTNKACSAHGYMKNHKKNYLYFKYNEKTYCYDSGDITEFTSPSIKLTEIFDKNHAAAVNKYFAEWKRKN